MSRFPQRLLKQIRGSEAPRRERRRRGSLPSVEQLEQRELLDAGGLITNLYADLLHRAPAAPEIAGWETFLQNGHSNQQMIRGILASQEYRGDQVQDDYTSFLGRRADAAEVTNWLNSGLGEEPIETRLLASAEYVAKHGPTVRDWLKGLYQDVLNRSSDANGQAKWEFQVTAGTSALTVATDIVGSSEAHARLVTLDYQQLLKRMPDQQGLVFWTAALDQGASPSSVVAGIAGSGEYALIQTANQATNTVVVSSADPTVSGQPITFTAAVAPAFSSTSLPTGTVVFTIDGAAQPAVTLTNGVAKLTVPTLRAGTHSVVAVYSGDSNFVTSTSATFSEVSNTTYVAPWQTPGLNVTKSGVVGDGVTDDTTALQKLINTSKAGTLFYFPAGTYVVSGTVYFHALGTFGIIGDTTAAGLPASMIKGTAANGRTVSVNYGSGVGAFQVTNMQFTAPDAGGTAFYTFNSLGASFANCTFSGHIGLYLDNAYVTAVRSSRFNGDGRAAGSHIGLMAWLPTESLVEGCDFSGWDEGIRAAGTGLSIIRSTLERNGTALRLGADANGNNWGFTRSALNDLTLKDNDTGLYAQAVGFSQFSNISIQGTANAPSGQSNIGMHVGYTQGSTFSGLQIGGGYSTAAATVTDGKFSTFYACNASNSIPTGLIWSVTPGLTGIFFSNTAPATITDVDDSSASGIVPSLQTPGLDVTKHGLVGDGVTDDTAALQALINSATPGTVFYFPQGVYKVSATIDFSRLSSFGLVGDVSSVGGSEAGSTIVGNFAGVLIKADYGSGSGVFQIHNLNLRSSYSVGVTLYARNAFLSSMQNVEVTGNIGIELVNPAMFSMRSVQFNGSAFYSTNIGLLVSGGTGCTVEQCDFMGWKEGLRASGLGLAVYASRFEVNHIGMNLGVDPNGNSSPLQNASFAGLSMEANDIFINALDCINSSFEGIGIDGTTNAPSGQSQVGVFVGASNGCTFSAIGMGGSYSNAAAQVSSTASNLLFDACSASNGLGGGTWVVDPKAVNVTLLVCY
jgi:Bacterial Ig-like domain (group 3)/Pectate lyase superfamily protein/Domain of unknown function (DUF4214)